jgi:hypothetical protein
MSIRFTVRTPSGNRPVTAFTQTVEMEVNRADIVEELTEQFERYERALVTNDVPALSAFFWDSPRAVRFGDRENQYGYDEIAAYRRAQPPIDPARQLARLVVTTFGCNFGVTSVEFIRTASADHGRQMQTWARVDGEWRIVAAHVSVPAPPA